RFAYTLPAACSRTIRSQDSTLLPLTPISPPPRSCPDPDGSVPVRNAPHGYPSANQPPSQTSAQLRLTGRPISAEYPENRAPLPAGYRLHSKSSAQRRSAPAGTAPAPLIDW